MFWTTNSTLVCLYKQGEKQARMGLFLESRTLWREVKRLCVQWAFWFMPFTACLKFPFPTKMDTKVGKPKGWVGEADPAQAKCVWISLYTESTHSSRSSPWQFRTQHLNISLLPLCVWFSFFLFEHTAIWLAVWLAVYMCMCMYMNCRLCGPTSANHTLWEGRSHLFTASLPRAENSAENPDTH